MHFIEEIEGYAFYLWVCDDVRALCDSTVYYNILAAGGTRRRDFMADFVCVLSVQRGQCFFLEREAGRRGMLILHILRYVLTNAIVLVCGFLFEWFYVDNLPMVLAMVLSIAVVYVIVSVAAWKHEKQQAALMNERLAAYQRDGQ